jgi:anti-sigma28 factor (negative regulator of flagellin synthesis)
MSIDRVNISNSGIERSQGAQPNELTRSTGKDRHVSSGSDSVALSSKANDLKRLATLVEESRIGRFNEVRSELESGTYRIPSADLAAKLIDANLK